MFYVSHLPTAILTTVDQPVATRFGTAVCPHATRSISTDVGMSCLTSLRIEAHLSQPCRRFCTRRRCPAFLQPVVGCALLWSMWSVESARRTCPSCYVKIVKYSISHCCPIRLVICTLDSARRWERSLHHAVHAEDLPIHCIITRLKPLNGVSEVSVAFGWAASAACC